MQHKRTLAGIALAAAAVVTLAGCSATSSATAGSGGDADWKTTTSAESAGGMDALVKAAKAEGQLNVITLPPTWANYGKIIDGFTKKYGIKINSANPNGSSADEVAAVKSQKGQSTAPDVLDLGNAVLQENLDLFADYKVANWDDIPTNLKDEDGAWTRDYTGLMSIGYDSSKISDAPKDMTDLLGSEYKGKVSIGGDPTQANQAASAVYLAALENGGSADDITKGVDFFGKLKQAGNFQNVLPTQATVASGETPVVVQWSYNNLAWGPAAGASGNKDWKTVVPKGQALGSYYSQAINKDAPHPAAARLWEEYIASPEVQNLYLQAGAFPSTLAALTKSGKVDQDALDAAGGAPKDYVELTDAQVADAAKVLKAKWSSTMGS
ncbi:ABC transporter substrate-binding protein [Curtobacterium flaccumfaciens pv. flaccumfaciens]|uniref:ABC transporter substrate-binding protein n=1 Tax=Curtobacterium TaxID=2034 RepID=UPI000DA6F09E|nr:MULTISPECIES: ABC transporter substrate-binding protein [Curtobacterium]MBO9046412.1 ABC transporter substrate-binding protein [Curtobacterium flaccumfaciens pv. flaccumfaciens]MBO9055853.1 ABC transporter substrate-binding protein [Curtobacterium flaccumfaciens pv. flaccumfaciens]MBT1665148.1 ABC transporter substrate-binding protein [Curtobacterium flaccumfaciens pv. flaccumfaciens]MCS6552471.1 ABC transporter substrate-binding protein [Curtobacterium flaccumfaciens pv. flaccumfaciens]QFS